MLTNKQIDDYLKIADSEVVSAIYFRTLQDAVKQLVTDVNYLKEQVNERDLFIANMLEVGASE